MRSFTKALSAVIMMFFVTIAVQAQITTGSISGTVVDVNGAAVPGATITVRSAAGQQYNVTSNSEGRYAIPGVTAGTVTYEITVTAPNFKTSVVRDVKVDVATPSTVNITMEAGAISETVVVTGGAEVLQTETPTIGSTLTGRQISETPIQSRDALDLVTLLPGTNTVGTARTSSINGLPKSAITIQIDGVDVQDNFLKSSDGFFTFIRPRLDAIDEVTVSTASPGAESSGDGAVGIRFATRRGTDDYRGSLFWQHRDEGLNATNFQNNYLGLPKQKLRLNQFGGSVGGPIPFLTFGHTDDWWTSGKGRQYFFINYERFHLNEASPTRARTVLAPTAATGVFRYGANGAQSVNVLQLAQAAGLPNTIDPTVAGLISTIATATQSGGSFQPLGTGGTFNTQIFNVNTPAEQRRRFLVVRTDFNLTKDHALEVIYNDQPFRGNFDTLNGLEPIYPGLQNAGVQVSDRRSLSIGLRSSFGSSIVNQFRYAQLSGWLGGSTDFDLVGGGQFFDQYMRGYSITPGTFTGIVARNAFSSRSSPTRDFTNNLTWVAGNHTMTFGGQLKTVKTISSSTGLFRPTINFAVQASDNALLSAISASNMPGATAAEVSAAQQLYATLTGRVGGFGANAVLSPAGQYEVNGPRDFEIEQATNGLYAQDTWRIAPNLTLNFGVRWQPVTGAKVNTANYSVLENFNMIYDVSGTGNLFSPGTLTGTVPRVRGVEVGESIHPDDLNNFAPSVGVVWSPDFGSGFGKSFFGGNGTSVIRAGFSRAYIREGTLTVENSIGLHPGGAFSLARSTALGNLTVGSLFRDPANPNIVPPAFNATPSYPRTLTTADAAFAFSPDFKTGYVDSWSVGYQRQLDSNTVVEVRYVGNRGKDMQLQYNLNSTNVTENGFAAEFNRAQQNLIANINAGRGANFRYFGPGTGTNPLPIFVSYLAGNNADPNATATYSGANFANSAYVNALSPAAPNVIGLAATFEGTAALRNAARAPGTFVPNGRPTNFINNCPTTLGACFLFDNVEKSWYDAGVIEVRRRLADGFRVQASYTYGKSFTNAFASAGTAVFGLGAGDQSNAGNVTVRNPDLDRSYSQIDVRHAFKLDATIDLPFGRGQRFLNSSNWASNAVFGGWSFVPVIRWQSGSPILMENVQLVGMTAKDLQKAISVYYNQTIVQPTGASSVHNVSWLPKDIIENTIRAFTVTGSTVTGYNTGAAPTGRFIAPAGYNNCQADFPGECGFRKLVIYGPDFFKFDTTLIKRIPFGETRSVEFRVTAFDLLNQTNWRLGGWTGNVNNLTAFTGTFGRMETGWSYQDPFGSNDPGGRLIDLMLRINF
jgi:hypothetical protein